MVLQAANQAPEGEKMGIISGTASFKVAEVERHTNVILPLRTRLLYAAAVPLFGCF